jgi:hypothetical protein
MIQDLAALRLHLDLAKGRGTHSPELTALQADYLEKEKKLLGHLEANGLMTREEFFDAIRSEIKALQARGRDDARVKADETKVRAEEIRKIRRTVIDGSRLVFHPIAPGKFKMGELGRQKNVQITKPFEMSATQTTQLVWREIAEMAQKKFPGKYRLNPDPSYHKGDLHPVESISRSEIETWIAALNALSESGEERLKELIPGYKPGGVYRLPTEAEWEFVARGRGQYQNQYHFGEDEGLLGDYAWFSFNSSGETHPVALKKPLVVDGQKFYDMHGNVGEWLEDFYWRAGSPSK